MQKKISKRNRTDNSWKNNNKQKNTLHRRKCKTATTKNSMARKKTKSVTHMMKGQGTEMHNKMQQVHLMAHHNSRAQDMVVLL